MPGLKPRSLYKTRGDSVPAKALVDGPQALLMSELGWFLDDVAVARELGVRVTDEAHGFSSQIPWSRIFSGWLLT